MTKTEVIMPSPAPPSSEVGSTMEEYREQGYETMVVNGLIDPVKNWGVAVADRDFREDESLR